MSAHATNDEQPEPRGRPSALGHVEPADGSVVAAIVRLRARGFVGEFVLEADSIPPGVFCRSCGHRHLARRMPVLAATRFTGATGAEPRLLVISMSCPRCSIDGLLIHECERDLTAGETALLADITARARTRRRDRASRTSPPRARQR